jgi:hypothetical protein
MDHTLSHVFLAGGLIVLSAFALALIGYVWLWSRYVGARHGRSYAKHIATAEREFGVSRHLIAAVIAGEALDALRHCRDWLEPIGELAAALIPKWREASSYGAGQLRLYEVRRFRKGNALIESDPRLSALSDIRLAWNRSGNIFLTAFKLKRMIEDIDAMTAEDIDAIRNRTGTNLPEIRRKAFSAQPFDLGEVSALYVAYNEEPERGMESGSYWDWLKARDVHSRIAERVAYQYAELAARDRTAAVAA